MPFRTGVTAMLFSPFLYVALPDKVLPGHYANGRDKGCTINKIYILPGKIVKEKTIKYAKTTI
jgi:hypothetical protein